MAQTKYEIMEQFEGKVLAAAIEKVDMDKAATAIANHIEKELARSAKEFLDNNVDFSEILSDIIWNEKSEAGKAFNKAMDVLATRMVSAFTGEITPVKAPKKNPTISKKPKKKLVKKKSIKRRTR